MWRHIALGVVGLVLAFAAYAIVARVWLHGEVTPQSLGVAMDRSVGTGGMAFRVPVCERTRRERVWTCAVVSPEQSGGAEYRVAVESGGSCWTAALLDDYSETRDMPRRADGCVRRWQWTALDLL